MRRQPWVLVAIILLLTLHPAIPAEEDETALTVYYTSSLNGNLEGCTCQSWPRAGLVKRAAYLRERERSAGSILIEAGDFLDLNADTRLTGHILDVYAELGYDVVCAGDVELSFGGETLIDFKSRLPLYCHNLMIVDTLTGKDIPFTEGPVILAAGRYTVGIICVLEEAVIRFGPKKTAAYGYRLLDSEKTTEALLSILEEKGVDVKLLLFHGRYETLLGFLPRFSGLDAVIFAHEQRLIEGHRVGETHIYSPGDEGNRVGILRLIFEKDGTMKQYNEFRLFRFSIDPDDPLVRKRINEYKKYLKEHYTQENH
ncbi:MAG: hypothetical protein JW881_07655 [Spirochaetales bacterium]|nr:hypothetical protein [Spirochaetales bacterium]